jgi:hypothetical protein
MTERLNIRRMQVPEAQKESELFFSPPPFQEMKAALDKKIQDAQQAFAAENWTDTVAIAASIATMYPAKQSESYIGDETWAKIEKYLNKLAEEDNLGNYMPLMRDIVLFRPSARPAGDLKERCLARVRDNMHYARTQTGNIHNMRHTASTAKLLFPEYEPDFTDKGWEKIIDDAKKERDRSRGSQFIFLNRMADIKIIAPERVNALTTEEKSAIREDLMRRHARKDLLKLHEGARHYAEEMINAKIMAAEKIEITENGLKFQLPGQIDDTPSRPPETLEV